MTGSQETFVDPDGAAKGAVSLSHAGESMQSRVSGALSKIQGFNEAKPWGTDDPGKEFNKNYLEAGEDGGDGIATSTLDVGKQLVDQVHQLGPDVTKLLAGTVEMDEMIAKWFPKTDGGE